MRYVITESLIEADEIGERDHLVVLVDESEIVCLARGRSYIRILAVRAMPAMSIEAPHNAAVAMNSNIFVFPVITAAP